MIFMYMWIQMNQELITKSYTHCLINIYSTLIVIKSRGQEEGHHPCGCLCTRGKTADSIRFYYGRTIIAGFMFISLNPMNLTNEILFK